MPRLSQIQAYKETFKTLNITDANGIEFHVTYSPERITSELVEEFTSAQKKKGDPDFGLLSRALQAFVTDWDLTDDSDKPLPLTSRTFKGIGIGVMMLIFSRIMEDQSVPEQNGRS